MFRCLPSPLLIATSNLRTNPTYISNNGDEPAWNPQVTSIFVTFFTILTLYFKTLKEAYARFDKLLHTIQFSPLSQPKFKNHNYYDPESSKNGSLSAPSQKSHSENKRSVPIPYRPFQPGFFNENDSTVDQLLDELNMAEEYSNDRKRLRERNSQSTIGDQSMTFGNSSYWDSSILSEAETNSLLNKNMDSYNRYRDNESKQRFPTATTTSGLQFHNSCINNDIGQSPKRSATASNVLNKVHNETGSEPSAPRSSFSGWTYRHPIIMQSIKSSMVNSNANKRKNNLSKATISPNLNVSFLTESERLAKTDLFLLPSDDSGGGHLYTGMTDISPSGDCSELMQVCNFVYFKL